MFSDYGRELLRSGIIEAKAGHKDAALRYLDRAAYMSHDHDVLAETWFWMSQLIDDKAEKRKALENCLAHNLQHARARRALAILDGKLKADEIVDPDHLPLPPEGLRSADAERFMCPKCGGRMSFSPDGQSLTCEYCSRNQKFVGQPGAAPLAGEKDFIVAMATARGHGKPLNQQVFHCEGCGCEFILPPNQISTTCVYCGSPHVVNWESEEQLLAPDGIIPHQFDQQRAIKYLVEWVEKNKIQPEKKVDLPRGVYLPLWTFDIGGEIQYVGEMYENDKGVFGQPTSEMRMKRVSDSYPVLINDLPIPAARKLSGVFQQLIPTFELKAVKPYEAGYLANWPAEVYDIPMAEASLDARVQALARYKRELPALIAPAQLISTSSSKMMVESFRLTLLPVWMTELPFGGREHLVLINGWTGTVKSDLPENGSGGLMEWLGDLIEG
ncbi:MAG: hypothetical protein IPM31_03990 [Anaerolineae bacterium]|nr:hypothetical protein [Anaerolineae bacterium]MBL8104916.1 hypothetical protein [Anaerolineales bacterium]MCC7189418.1 hypothetical protein [Anaerolineales bacterium]